MRHSPRQRGALAIALLLASAFTGLVEAPARAEAARASFVVSALVVDACTVGVEGSPGAAGGAATLRSSCTSGAASVSGVGPGGNVTAQAVAVGAPARVTTAAGPQTSRAANTLIVTLAF